MNRSAITVFLFLAFCLASCASTTNYPITLSYQPVTPQYEKAGGASIAVATLADRRPVTNKRILGTKEDGVQFIALIDDPAAALSKGFAVYLVNRGFMVNRTDEVWDGDVKSISQSQGNFIIGGTLDDLAINVKGNLLKTEYDCSVKFTLSVADIKTKELLHREKFDVSTSYVTLPFSREKAEELINKALSESVEKSLAGINSYLPGHTRN